MIIKGAFSVKDINPTIQEQFLSDTQVAERLQISRAVLQRYRLTGCGPKYLRIARNCVRYRWADVEKWLNQKLIGNTKQAKK